jgi:hypothetical protein
MTATPQPSWDTLTAQLADAAAALAQAQVEEEARAADDPTRWRDAGLLWPDMNLDTKG